MKDITSIAHSTSTITIIRVTLNTELDTMRLKSQQAQMAYSEVETLVFPDSMCLREGLYVELF